MLIYVYKYKYAYKYKYDHHVGELQKRPALVLNKNIF